MKNKKILAVLSAMTILVSSMTNVFAASIGDITVQDVDGDANPTINQIDWDETFPIGNLEGSVEDIVVKASVKPTLDMGISSDVIDLGVLIPGTASEGSLDIEVGTNAKDGVVITVQSQNGALKNIDDNTVELDGEYKYSSTNQNTGDYTDSTITGFTVSNTLTEVAVDTNVNTIYETNKAENNDDTIKDLKFNVSMTASNEAVAGDYEDLLTFTITGRF